MKKHCNKIVAHTEKHFIVICDLFYNDNSNKYLESRENRGAIIIFPSRLKFLKNFVANSFILILRVLY